MGEIMDLNGIVTSGFKYFDSLRHYSATEIKAIFKRFGGAPTESVTKLVEMKAEDKALYGFTGSVLVGVTRPKSSNAFYVQNAGYSELGFAEVDDAIKCVQAIESEEDVSLRKWSVAEGRIWIQTAQLTNLDRLTDAQKSGEHGRNERALQEVKDFLTTLTV